MEKQYHKTQADSLTMHLLRTYSKQIRSDALPDTPFLLTGIRMRIAQEQELAHYWAQGVVRAQKWLIGLSFIAILFFAGNLVTFLSKGDAASPPFQQSLANEADERDYIEESLNIKE